MLADTLRQCMRDIGLSEESTERIAALLQDSRKTEAKQRLRRLRCELMEELHVCQRKVDRLDWLIRETEKQQNNKSIDERKKQAYDDNGIAGLDPDVG